MHVLFVGEKTNETKLFRTNSRELLHQPRRINKRLLRRTRNEGTAEEEVEVVSETPAPRNVDMLPKKQPRAGESQSLEESASRRGSTAVELAVDGAEQQRPSVTRYDGWFRSIIPLSHMLTKPRAVCLHCCRIPAVVAFTTG